jgi:hypothetical protein
MGATMASLLLHHKLARSWESGTTPFNHVLAKSLGHGAPHSSLTGLTASRITHSIANCQYKPRPLNLHLATPWWSQNTDTNWDNLIHSTPLTLVVHWKMFRSKPNITPILQRNEAMI